MTYDAEMSRRLTSEDQATILRELRITDPDERAAVERVFAAFNGLDDRNRDWFVEQGAAALLDREGTS